jgi:hypothetical protein
VFIKISADFLDSLGMFTFLHKPAQIFQNLSQRRIWFFLLLIIRILRIHWGRPFPDNPFGRPIRVVFIILFDYSGNSVVVAFSFFIIKFGENFVGWLHEKPGKVGMKLIVF